MIKAWRKRYEIMANKVYKEILSFMVCDFRDDEQSLCSLDRRLGYFNIHRNDKSVKEGDNTATTRKTNRK